MALTLHRTHSLNLALKKPGSIRAFAFDVELGLGKRRASIAESLTESNAESVAEPNPVDPESGMLLNLVRVDELLEDLAKELGRATFASTMKVLEHSIGFLNQELLRDDGVVLTRIVFKEKRGEFFAWDGEYFCGRSQILEFGQAIFYVEATYRAPERKSTITALFEDVPMLHVKEFATSSEAALETLLKEAASIYFASSEHLVRLEIEPFGRGFQKVFSK